MSGFHAAVRGRARAAPGARVVYVDNDPVVNVHANALLTGGLRDPAAILAHPGSPSLDVIDHCCTV